MDQSSFPLIFEFATNHYSGGELKKTAADNRGTMD